MDGYGYSYGGYSGTNAPGYSSYNAPRTDFAPAFVDSDVRRRPSVSFAAVPSTTGYYLQRPEPLEGFNRIAETGRPRFSPVSSQYWSQSQVPNTNGYNDYNNNSSRPNFDRIREENNFGVPFNKLASNVIADAAMITGGGWARPTAVTWATLPNGTNVLTDGKNIDAAMDILKDAKKPTVVAGAALEYLKNSDRPTVAASAAFDYLKDGGHKDSTKRYGKFNLTPRHYTER